MREEALGALRLYGMAALQRCRLLTAAEESENSVVLRRDQSEAQRAHDSKKEKPWKLEDTIEARGVM